MHNVQCLHVDSVRASDVDGIQYQVSASVQRCVVISYSICAAPPPHPSPPPTSPVDPRCPACIHNPLASIQYPRLNDLHAHNK